MFGLTKREQRWKAEQQAAEVLAALAGTALRAAADVRIAEAKTDAEELARLRAENAQLWAVAEAARKLDAAMVPHKFALLDTSGSDDWDWAWDQLADSLAALKTPNSELFGARRASEPTPGSAAD